MNSEEHKLMGAYNRISPRYVQLKTKPWKDFQSYLSSLKSSFTLPSSGILLDIGTGNGRNLLLFKDHQWQLIASDLSFPLLSSLVPLPSQKIHILNNDMRFLPLKQNIADFVICVATIHHLSNKKDRISLLDEITRSLKDEGYLILSCWRRWKSSTLKRMLIDLLLFPLKKLFNTGWKHGDILLPWYNEKQEIIARRYYHLFTKRELLSVIKKTSLTICDFSCCGGQKGKDNFFVLLRKKKLSN